MEGDAIEEPRKSARDITGDKVDNTRRFDMLSKFKYGDLKLEDYHIKDVLDHLSKNRIFQGKLDFSDQNLTDQSLLKIAKIIPQPLPQILELILQRNVKLGTSGISELAESISQSHCL